MENKKDKFVRLGESRVNDAIKKIRLIGNLSNKNNYEYTSEQVNEIITALKSEIEDVQKSLQLSKIKKMTNFNLESEVKIYDISRKFLFSK